MSKRFTRLACLLLLAAFPLAQAPAFASKKLATETGRTCTTCHDKPGSRLLTDAGKYFETTRTLDGFDQVKESFGKCTMCHVRKPGSHRLTAKGKEFAGMIKDMKDLGEWVRQNHPAAPTPTPAPKQK